MTVRRRTIEAILILPLVALIAVVGYCAFWIAIKAGNALVYAWHWVLHDVLSLPGPLAIALAFVLTPLTVLAVFYILFKRRPRFWLKV